MCTYGQRTCNSNIQEGGRIRRGSRKLNFKNDRLNYIKCFENCFKLSHGSKCVIEAMYSVIGNFHFISICSITYYNKWEYSTTATSNTCPLPAPPPSPWENETIVVLFAKMCVVQDFSKGHTRLELKKSRTFKTNFVKIFRFIWLYFGPFG